MSPRRASRSLVAGLLVATAATLTACTGSAAPDAGGTVTVVASFAPLAAVVEAVGGDRVTVTDLTPPGVEPHDLELSPQDVADVASADLVVHLAGFQPAVDDAASGSAEGEVLDVSQAARLLPTPDGSAGSDPHFWLDPTRVADVADAVAAALSAVDPAGATAYQANAADLRTELETLDQEMTDGLADCRRRTLVTSHAAFGYLADRYGLEQVAVAGVDPEAEPTPADLARVATVVRDEGVTTVFTEPLVSPALAETVARETGVATAVLDPVESLPAGDDYRTVMRRNLTALRVGLDCR